MRKARLWGLLACLSTLLLVASGCGEKESADAQPNAAELVGVWSPTALYGAPYAEDGYEPITVEFNKEGRFTTSDGCNFMEGEYSVDGSRFTSAGLGTTERGCSRERVPIPELLLATKEIRPAGNQLTMLDEQGEVIGDFLRQ